MFLILNVAVCPFVVFRTSAFPFGTNLVGVMVVVTSIFDSSSAKGRARVYNDYVSPWVDCSGMHEYIILKI